MAHPAVAAPLKGETIAVNRFSGSVYVVPANEAEIATPVATPGALFIDLEGTLAPSAKVEGRVIAERAVRQNKSDFATIVRVNARSAPGRARGRGDVLRRRGLDPG
jgi:citrate lyase beta subunit